MAITSAELGFNAPVWGAPGILDPDATDHDLPAINLLAFAAAHTKLRRFESADTIKERKNLMASSLTKGVISIHNTFYPQYNVAGLAADEIERLKAAERSDVAKLLNPHMDDATGPGEDPSLHAQEISQDAFIINQRARLELNKARTHAARQRVMDIQEEDLRQRISRNIFVGESRADRWYRRIHRPTFMSTSTLKSKRLWIGTGIGAGTVAAIVAGLWITGNGPFYSPYFSYTPNECITAPPGSVVSGYDLTAGPDNAHLQPVNPNSGLGTRRATVLIVNQTGIVCDGGNDMRLRTTDQSPSQINDTVTDQQNDLNKNGCGNGCPTVDIFRYP